MLKRTIAIAAAMLVAAGLAGAATTTDQSLQVHNPRLKIQWAGDQTRVPPFDKVFLAPLELDFRPVEPLTGVSRIPADRTDFPVSEEQRQNLQKTVTDIFREELGKEKHFTLTDEPGPGVLTVKPSLRDIVSRVPPEEPPGRSAIYIDSVGDATLVVDFVDSATGITLGSATDRRTARPAGTVNDFGALRATTVAAGQEVRRLARSWAMSLDKRLEQLYFEAKPR